MTINAYPLQWPVGWKRTDHFERTLDKFGKRVKQTGSSWKRLEELTVSQGVQRVLAELQRMAVSRDDCVISTNVPTRMDGLPRSDAKKPADPGVAVYWTDPHNSAPRVMAIDQYTEVAANLAAVAATLEAMRAIERHGGAVILERAFTGFTALPAPGAAREWWEVLGVTRSCSRDDVRAAYRRLASAAHPDKPGGSHERMAELNAAQEAALLEKNDG